MNILDPQKDCIPPQHFLPSRNSICGAGLRCGFMLQTSEVPFAGNCSRSLTDSGNAVCVHDCSAVVRYLAYIFSGL